MRQILQNSAYKGRYFEKFTMRGIALVIAMSHSALSPDKYLSFDEQVELGRILQVYRFCDLRDTTLIMFMLKTGSRPQETLNVRWRDIDFRNKSVFIETMKGGRARSVPLDTELANRLLALANTKVSDLVFPICYRQFVRIWHEYRPVEKKLHCLRHTFAVNLYERSGKISVVQQALGHVSIHTTSVYLQIQHSMEELREFIK